MHCIQKLAALAIATGIGFTALHAQTATTPTEHLQLAVDYSYMRANAGPGQCGCFNLSGGSAEAAFHLWRGFSAVADLTGEHAGSSNIPGQSLSLLVLTAGPRFTLHPHRFVRLAPFAQSLIGGVHGFDAPFPHASGAVAETSNSFAVFAGGGLDIFINHHLAIRPVQVDYGLSQLPNNANDHQNLFRYSAGIVLHLR